MIDANGLERGRVTWLRRGWPDLFDELARILPRLREFV
jgi:phosphoadenosine phosphosulfate reductase